MSPETLAGPCALSSPHWLCPKPARPRGLQPRPAPTAEQEPQGTGRQNAVLAGDRKRFSIVRQSAACIDESQSPIKKQHGELGHQLVILGAKARNAARKR